MKKQITIASLSLFTLIGAAYPQSPQLAYGAAVMGGSTEVAGLTYRPCRSRSDDNCIQLYERGVRASYAQWLRDQRGMGGPEVRTAAAAPHSHHPAHHAAQAQARCVEPQQQHQHEDGVRGM